MFRHNSPSKCDECYARGLICRAQGRGSADSTDAEPADRQAYSLRQRVSFLEEMVKSLVQNAGKETSEVPSPSVPGLAYEGVRFQVAAAASSISLDLNAAPLPTQGPILSLFHNDVMTRSVAGKDASASTSKAENISCHLRRLLPASEEIDAILVAGTGLWSDWFSQFPELWSENRVGDFKTEFWRRIASSQPVEVAKMLIFLLITIDNIPAHSFHSRINVKEKRNVFITQIEHSVIQDIDFARTVPGTQCIALLAKYLAKIGHLLSAWHLVRRAIEYAIVFGMQLPCSSAPVESGRKNLALWTSLCHYDSYLSLILGFPYCAPSVHVARQSKLLLDGPREIEYAEIYFLSVTTIMRRIINRNQIEPKDLLETLKIDQDLDELAAQSPGEWWHLVLDSTHSNKMNTSRFIVQMLHHFIRALLHLPFLLQESSDPKQRLCYDAALASARSVANSYRILRGIVGLIPYLGILADFQAFTMAILLIVHNARRENESSIDIRQECSRDWNLITDITNILRSVALTSEENVALQGQKILEKLVEVRNQVESEGFGQGKSCKITIPCFGAVTISLGKQIMKSRNQGEDELPERQSVGRRQPHLDSAAPGQSLQENSDYDSEQQPQGLLAEIENLIALPSMGFGGGEDALPNTFEYEPSYDLDRGWDLSFFD
jgi:hypothetical protein